MTSIKLSNGPSALIDDWDVPLVNQFKWHASEKAPGKIYAQTRIRGRFVTMHRLIMGVWDLASTSEIDHVNGNGLDNQRCNLRFATHQENTRSQRLNCRNKLGLKGVTQVGRRFRATISLDGGTRHLGYYDTPHEAHEAYVKAARKWFGEFAHEG